MGINSSIEWLLGGATWNPIRARRKDTGKVGWFCVKVSPACMHCYAELQNVRCGTNPGRMGNGVRYALDQMPLVEIFIDEDTLNQPLHWKKPRYVFPCSMTDLYGDFVTDNQLDQVHSVMERTRQHTYIVLTKRPERRRDYLRKRYRQDSVPPNIWHLTSCGTQKEANENIPPLLETPAAVRGISAEPLLEEINLHHTWLPSHIDPPIFSKRVSGFHDQSNGGLHWVIAGGESGPKARGCNIQSIRVLAEQCAIAGIPLFIKQLGAKPFLKSHQSVDKEGPGFKFSIMSLEIQSSIELSDPKGGDWDEWPSDLRVREFPKVEVLA